VAVGDFYCVTLRLFGGAYNKIAIFRGALSCALSGIPVVNGFCDTSNRRFEWKTFFEETHRLSLKRSLDTDDLM
jgi:hypothetical protein